MNKTRAVVILPLFLLAACTADFPDRDFDGAVDQGSTPSDHGGAVQCTNAEPCGGYACRTLVGVCRVTCTRPSHCASGYTCTPERTCVPITTCTDASPCGGYACDRSTGECYISCDDERHCAEGYRCDDPTCVPD